MARNTATDACPRCGVLWAECEKQPYEEIVPGVFSFECPRCEAQIVSDERGRKPIVKVMV